MTDTHPPKSAVLMIRVWRDGSARSGFRARVVQVSPPVAGQGAVAADVEEVSDLVTEWLQAFLNNNDASPE